MDIKAELIELTLKHSPGQGVHPTRISGLQIARSDRRTEPVHTVYRAAICFIVQGEKSATVSGKSYRYSASQYLVTSVDLPVTGQVTVATAAKPYLCLIADIDPSQVYEVLKEAGELGGREESAAKGIFVDKVNPDLTDAFLRLARCLESPVDERVLAPLVLREITYRLLSSKYGGIVRQVGVAGSRTQRVSRVIELIKRDYARTLNTAELAKAAGMSASSLHHHFKQVTTMSPLQFQKQIRLQEARRLLSAELADAATAGFKVGYESPSQFSREYARLFGLPPMRDLKRLRAGASLS